MTRRPTLTPFALLTLVLGFSFALGDATASADVPTPAIASFGVAAALDTRGVDMRAADADIHAASAGTFGRDACPESCDSCDGGVCHIACEVGSACEEQTVACPPGMDCEVSCNGDGACESSTIVGPQGYALEVECSGRASCGDIVLDSGRDLELSCKGSEACHSATLHCSSGACDWACSSPGSCDGMAVE